VRPGIWLDEAGVAWLQDARTKVIEVVLCQRADNLTLKQVHKELPHLSVEQIETALAYYHAHQNELDEEIEGRLQWVLELQKTLPPGPTREELLARLKAKP
jgi:uncharacterized protein (DUF433 family)